MSLTVAAKKTAIKDFVRNAKDTGSPEVQVAIMTARIKDITSHLETHPKDIHSRRGLLLLVGKRRRLLNYLKRKDEKLYTTTIEKLDLRK
ncbi:MAG: 30S ribosomal protein S15 [Hydrotalea sp.]|nr:30S ribosomal protein S15 [Hydrotalea sp.]